MLKVLIETKMYRAQQQMSNFNREMEMLIKNQMEMLEVKDTVTQLKNAFNGLLHKLDTAKERIIEHKDISSGNY